MQLYPSVAVTHNSNQMQAAAAQMASLQGMHGLLQTPAVSTVSSLHTPQQFLAAAAAGSPQYSTVQKILIPGSKVSLMLRYCVHLKSGGIGWKKIKA